MADNVTLNAGSGGDIIATEDTGGAEYQKIKITDGTATSTTMLKVAAEDAAHGDGDTGLVAMAVRSDTLAALAGTTNDYTPLQVNKDGALYSVPGNFISTANTTTTPLGVSGNFTGTAEDVSGYSSVTIFLYANVASATDGMVFEFCDESGFTNPYQHLFTMSADSERIFQLPVTAQYFRVNYTNGGTGQTTFRVQTILHANPTRTTIHRLGDDVSPDRSAEVVKTALMAQISGSGNFTAIDATTGGNLKVSVEEGTQTPADADATPTDAIHSQSFNSVYNGSTWDLVREGGVAGSVLVENRVSVSATGTTTYYNNDLDEAEVEVDTGPVNIYSIQAFNTTAAPLFLQMWNTNTVTVGTTTPTNQYVIPGNADSDGAGFSITFAVPKAYSTALSIACTTNSEGSGAPGVGACIINIEYAT